MASSIVKSAAQQLGNLLLEEAKSLYNVRDKIESLQKELEFMESFLRDADSQQHRRKVVRLWVSEVRDLSYDIEDTIEGYLHRVSHHRGDGIRNTLKWFSCILVNCDVWTLHNLGSDIDNLAVRMADLKSRLQMYDIKIINPGRSLEYNPMIREEMRTHSHTEEDVVGLVEDIQLLVDQLVKETNVRVVGISGTGGLGKTTLARKVFKHSDIKDHFNDACVWVYVSKEFEMVKLFQDILFGLDKGCEIQRIRELPVEELVTKIHELLQKKRCLVVLDDIWYQTSWDRVKPAFEILKSSSASKILLTTRNQDLLKHVDPCGYLHLQQPLSDDESWELLKGKAFAGHGSTDDDQVKSELEKLGKEMLKHCDGLPIAIVAIGGILSTKKTISEWEDVQTNISSYLMSGMEQEGTSSRILEILELSYNELPFYLKPCFLYLGNFPEDYEISTQRLYHLWAAEGFLAIDGEAKNKGGTSYDIGERYLNELVQRSMVLVKDYWASGKIKTCQVHDVMRDMCLRKCEEVSFLSHLECMDSGMVSVLPPFSVEIKKLRRCALHGESENFVQYQVGEKAIGLRSLLVFNKRCKLARNTWKSIPLLRVLDLDGVIVYSDDLYGLKYLIHLRYLSLRETTILGRELPSCLFDLQYLETLDLRVVPEYAVIMVSNKFCKMKRLRHLYLPYRFIIEGDERLSFPMDGKMETLKKLDPERCEIKGLMQMTNLRVFSIQREYIFEKPEELKEILEAPVMKKAGQLINSLTIRIHEDVIKEDPRVLSSAKCNPGFEKLIIRGPQRLKKDENKGDSVIFPSSLKQVKLNECEIGEEGGLLLGLEKIPGLQVLKICNSGLGGGGGGGNKLSLTSGSFPQLRELCIIDPKGSVFEWDVGEAGAANLQTFKLQGCQKGIQLKNVPKSLTEVELWSCGITDGKISGLEKLPHLKSLSVRAHICNKLSFSADSFPGLTKLYLEMETELCGEWEVGEGALPNLRSLQANRLKKVINKLPDSLTEVELIDCYIAGEGEDSLFACLGKLPYLQLLTMTDCRMGSGCKKVTFPSNSFPQLTQLTFQGPDDLEEWEVGEESLPHLQCLKVQLCMRLKKMNKLPDNLTQVELIGGDIIGEASGDGSILVCLGNLPRLQQLSLTEVMRAGCKEMTFSPGSFPHLTQLHIDGLGDLEEWEVGEDSLPHLQRLVVDGNRNKLKKVNKLPDSLTDVELRGCELVEGGDSLLACLEKLPRLQLLTLYQTKVSLQGCKMSFSPGSFPQLTQLTLNGLRELKEWEVGEGALSNLQHLDLFWCKNLKKLPQRLPASAHIECKNPCIKGIKKYNTCPHFKKGFM